MSKQGLLLSNDLFFTSKITGTANALGFQVDVLGNAAGLAERLAENNYVCIIVDLAFPAADPEIIVAAAENSSVESIIGYGPHVHHERLAQAEAAGFTEVLSRGQFDANLATILQTRLGE